MVTMSDVARSAGVSPMTVSNVVNGRSGVSDEVRERVQQAIRDSGYRMNVVARHLRSGRSGVIGLAVPEVDVPYFGRLGSLMTREARSRGYRIAIEETGALPEAELAAIEQSRVLHYDGLILSSVDLDLHAELEALGSFPTVLLGERPAPPDIAAVRLPNRDGTRAATQHLIERGARRIVFLGAPVHDIEDVHSLRLAGYREALVTGGITPDPALEVPVAALDMVAGREAVHGMHRQGLDVDAVVAVTDSVAFGALRGLADAGRRVPEDVMVAGFDDVPESAFWVPSLTSVAPDPSWIACTAIELLLAQISGGPSETTTPVAPFVLVERESTSRR